MRTIKFIIGCFIFFIFVGCGSGGDELGETKEKTKKAILSEENILKFVQAVHYIEKLDIDLNIDSNYSIVGRTVENHLNETTGLGYFEFFYKDFKSCCSNDIINGVVRVDITHIDKINSKIKTKGKFDLKLTTEDNNISLYVTMSSIEDLNFDDGSDDSSLLIKEYRIYDQKNDEYIEILDAQNYLNETTNGTSKLYIKSEGYVDFKDSDSKS